MILRKLQRTDRIAKYAAAITERIITNHTTFAGVKSIELGKNMSKDPDFSAKNDEITGKRGGALPFAEEFRFG